MTEKNPFYEGFKYGNTTDKIRFFYYDFEANNFFKANTILSDKNILTESDKSKAICSIDDNGKNSTNLNQIFIGRKSSSQLSTGAIVGIVVPCIAALLLAILFAMYHRKKIIPIEDLQNNTIMNLKLQNSQNTLPTN